MNVYAVWRPCWFRAPLHFQLVATPGAFTRGWAPWAKDREMVIDHSGVSSDYLRTGLGLKAVVPGGEAAGEGARLGTGGKNGFEDRLRSGEHGHFLGPVILEKDLEDRPACRNSPWV